MTYKFEDEREVKMTRVSQFDKLYYFKIMLAPVLLFNISISHLSICAASFYIN